MNINIITVGSKMPEWVEVGSADYLARLKNYCKINLITLNLATRNKNTNPEESKKIEGQSILAKINNSDHVIALDSRGTQHSSESLAEYVDKLQTMPKNICIIIGGPDGLSTECLQRANDQISLSKLTLPHPLVRIVLVEQLYRAFTILKHLPYHK